MSKCYLLPLHCGISVSNIEASINWYREVLDFELISCKDMPMLKAKVAFIKHGNFEIELFEHYESNALPADRLIPNLDIKTQGTKHICFQVENIDSLINRFQGEAVDVVIGPMMVERDYVAFIRDNNGTLIEFIQR